MKIEKYFNDKRIILIQGDITDSETDAIVNAANDHLWMGSGLAGAIKAKGGVEIEEEAMKKGPIPIGETVVTSAGNLKAKYVIHAAVMGQDLQTSEKYIRAATLNSLKRAEELKLSSIAFPALGTGVGGMLEEKCADVMMTTIKEFLKSAKSIKEVTFALFDEITYLIFEEELYIDEKLIKDSEFIDNFIYFNAFCRGATINLLWEQLNQREKGDKLAYLLDIYSIFAAKSEDIAKIIIALVNKKNNPNNTLFYYYCKNLEDQDWKRVYRILKTNSLDELLVNINLPKVSELKYTPNYENLLKKEDYYQQQIDKALRCLSAILVLRKSGLFRDAYNSIKHGLKFIVWHDKQEYFFINKAESENDSTTLIKGHSRKLSDENVKLIVENFNNIELSLGVILGWYYLLKFKVDDKTINNIFNGCLAYFDKGFNWVDSAEV